MNPNNSEAMNPSNPEKATILQQALSFASKEARDAYLQGACGEDADLRACMDALVKAHLAAGDFLEGRAPGAATTLASPPGFEEGPDTVIGRYKLLQQIGEGGCGVVYMSPPTEGSTSLRTVARLLCCKQETDLKS